VWLALALCLSLVRLASADPLEDETRRIAKQLQCPVCESVSVADSPSELAGQMRGVIRRKLEQGESEGQILAYFVERYGDGVLVEPPRRGFSLAVWLGPLIALVGGAALLVVLLKRWAAPRWLALPTSRQTAAPTAATNGRARDESGLNLRRSSGQGPPGATKGEDDDVGDYGERVRRELERFRGGA
jgi:cytochrome c-type biogenesis protein CcmH